jgi:formate dehydrogenase subunit delta
MSHDETTLRLVRMANQIGTFFSTQSGSDGAANVADHINKFWEPRMRRHFFEIFDAGGEGLKPIVLEAAPQIRRPSQHVTAEQAAEAGAVASG